MRASAGWQDARGFPLFVFSSIDGSQTRHAPFECLGHVGGFLIVLIGVVASAHKASRGRRTNNGRSAGVSERQFRRVLPSLEWKGWAGLAWHGLSCSLFGYANGIIILALHPEGVYPTANQPIRHDVSLLFGPWRS